MAQTVSARHPITWSSFEKTKLRLDPSETVQALAELSGSTAALSRLQHLCLASDNPKFLGALLHLVSTPEAQGILADWAPENRHAAGLARLGRTLWGEQQAVADLRPFKEDRRVEDEFRGKLDSQYLAAMAAARRALPAGKTTSWLQKLRIYIVLRAIDALETNVVRERHLFDICRTVRIACESTDHPNWELFVALTGEALGFQGFVAEATVNCRSAAQKHRDRSGRAFFESLLSVLEDRGWAALPGSQATTHSHPLEPYPTNGSWNALANLSAFTDQASNTFKTFQGTHDDDNAIVAKHRTSQKRSAHQHSEHGQGLRLEHTERSLFLPHSWHQLSDVESLQLQSRITELLTSAELRNRFGAASTLIALLCSQSMHDVSVMQLSATPSDNWSLDLANRQLVRLAPRFARRWRLENAGPHASSWLHPLGPVWKIQLDKDVCEPFRTAKKKIPTATSLHALWAAFDPPDTLSIWFNTVLSQHPDLSRVTSPVLVNPAALHVFQQSQDHALARLVTSDARTALPSACAYAAYRAPQVVDALSAFVQSELAVMTIPNLNEELNVAGSELDVRLAILQKTIHQLTQRVAAASHSRDWVEHHNLLTALTVLALLASTGARPVNSPFESLAWIDLERGLLYVQDKTAGPTQGSRICVLSEVGSALLREQYLPQLSKIAAGFRVSEPAFSAEIDKLLDPATEAMLPLFFFLREKPGIDWIEVSESELERVCQFDWPLPWNLFRHLTSTWLGRWGLEPDIRDALLGHADRDAEPHGYYSPRIPHEDLEQARPLVNRLASEVGFAAPGNWRSPDIPAGLALTRTNPGFTRLFGRKARAMRRELTLVSAQNLARTVIQDQLGVRTVDQLTPDQIDAIALSMLFREDGMPHPMGSVRYEVFETFLKQQWTQHGRHAKVSRRYVVILEGRQLFTEEAIGARDKLNHFRDSFEAFAATRGNTTERPVIAATLAAIDLVLNSKLSNFKALSALLCNHHSIQLVHFDSRYWFEWSGEAAWQDGKPVFRIEISSRAARWLAQVVASRRLTAVPATPAQLANLFINFADENATLAKSMRYLAHLQEQDNALTLSGIEAGYLCGARPSSGLPHADWIRLIKGAAPLQSAASDAENPSIDAAAIIEVEHFFSHHHKRVATTTGTVLERCSVLFEEIRKDLNSTSSNLKIATEISREVRVSGFGRGDAPFVLAHFAIHLLKRKPQKGTKDTLRSSTAMRYWDSLAPSFLALAADVNLMAAEDEDLTQLYEQIIRATDFPVAQESDGATASVTPRKYSNATDSPLRALTQLRDFHEFARAAYGLADPDWSEITPDISIGIGRPGIIRVQEYLTILQRVVGSGPAETLDPIQLSCAFVLVVCARFGLRIGEAVGLNRCDWIELAQTLTVLVRSNSTRTLKTIPSKRQVPRIEDLTELEHEIIRVVLSKWTHREGVSLRTPLLPGVSRSTFKSVKAEISSRLLESIKAITGNDSSTVHMLRHAFAMRILALVWGQDLDPSMPVDQQNSLSARRLLTGSSCIDKRLLWAVSRLLGHASPGVTLQSYVNCLYLFLSPLRTAPAEGTFAVPHVAINLDRLELSSDYLPSGLPTKTSTHVETTPAFLRCMRAVRLIGIGQHEKQAFIDSGLPPHEGDSLIAVLTGISMRLPKTESRFGIFNLLHGIPIPRLSKLLTLVENGASTRANATALADWEMTVGSSRQVLLFEPHHFDHFALFVDQLKLSHQDVWLVSKRLPPPNFYQKHIERLNLDRFVHGKAEIAKTFQLDVAKNEMTLQTWPDRLAVVPVRKGKFDSTFELLILWLIWHFSVTLN